jgi:hypothetical protein
MNESKYNSLKSGQSIALLSVEDLKKLQSPIGKAVYQTTMLDKKNDVVKPKRGSGRPRIDEQKLADPKDRLTCELCGGTFTRCHKSQHNGTKVHQAYMRMNQKLVKLLLDNSK